MIVALALATFGFQVPGPTLPPSCSPAFQAAVLAVEGALQNQDFALAAAKFKLLPKRSFSVVWDDSKVPPGFRSQFRKAGDTAVALWQKYLGGGTITIRSQGEIRISFEPVLAKTPGTNLPAAHVGFFSEEPGAPRLDFVIGLKLGAPLKDAEVTDIFNAAAYGIGTYLGVSNGVFDTYVMSPSDLPSMHPRNISGTESSTVRQNLHIVQFLESAIKDKIQVAALKSDLFIDPLVLDGEPAIQGDHVEYHIQLSNKGDGPLTFSLYPDCGCTIVTDPGTVNPRSSRLVSVAVDTTNFTANTIKHVTVYTNDPTNPVQVVTINVKVKPRYRLIAPLGDTVAVPSQGLKYPIYLIPAKGTDLEPVSTTFTNINGVVSGEVTSSAWQGTLADPEVNEGPMPRKGYKFVINLSGNVGPGRTPGTLQIYTSNPAFPILTYSMNIQKGIIALPDELPMGEVGKVPKTVWFIVSRPGKPFKIHDVTTNSPNLKATAMPSAGSTEYRIQVRYDGSGRRGELLAAVKVFTDDPKQPVIDVPVRANIQ